MKPRIPKNHTFLGATDKSTFLLKFFTFCLTSQNVFLDEQISKDLEKLGRFYFFQGSG